ncbi:serine hydrolase domain-containing protein [Robertkochia solimangrovi]|uniref:serine hydrolase domain-containing protein n=1 Tax=Robertkochia solimangrovi TaxID=2213046 RepID=UPI00117CF42B|nr:serine hydrolase domain-containing protein [Robertkochia solimangrovi]TRZ42426.1 serine hydrolase [Robertkochia solimangrovi]
MIDQLKSPVYKFILQCFVLFLIASCSSGTQESGTEKEQLERGLRGQVKILEEPEKLSTITDQMKAYKIPTLSLAVIREGQIDWSEMYLNPDFSDGIIADSIRIFQAASLSKPVTFMAALRMHSAGEIDLDKDIEEYLQRYTLPAGKQTEENPVTFRNIFSHTSGITAGGYEGYERSLPIPSDRDILEGKEGANSPAIAVITPPNEQLLYSGGGYTLAETALQDLYQEDFSKIMKKWILEPVGMHDSEFTQPLPATKINQVAKGHAYTGEVIEGGWRNHPEQAAAGLWSNATDMAKFLIEIYKAYHGNSAIFSQDDIRTILNQERDGHVYGFIVDRSGDEIAITHYGGNAGYRTGMTISLTSGNGLVYLTNSDNGGNLGNELLLSASQIYNWKHFKQTEVQRKQVSDEVLNGLAGAYKWNDQIDLSIGFDESTRLISLYFPNGDQYELVPIQGDALDFIHSNTGVQVSFQKENNFRSFTLYGQSAIRIENNTFAE